MQVETPSTKMAGGCGQFIEQSRFAFEPAHNPGSHRQAAEKKDIDRDEREGGTGESFRAKSKAHLGRNYRISRQFGHGKGSRSSVVLQ